MSKFRKDSKKDTPGISTASLPDIVFMLLFFFMVTTVMRETTIMVQQSLPQATEIQKLEKKSLVSYIYIGSPVERMQGTYGTKARIQLNDAFATVDDIPQYITAERTARDEKEVPFMTTSIKADQNTKMGIVTDVILPLSLAFIMFSLGLGLSLSDFTRVFFKPRDFLIGLFFQIIVLPIVALIIVMFWPLSPELAIGVMILAAAPGGVTSNVLTSFAKGNIALSISLTAINSILCVITVPLILMISLSVLDMGSINEGQSLFSVASQMFLIVTIPVIIGVLLS